MNIKKLIPAALLLSLPHILQAQSHKLVKLWETDSLAVPESVLPDIPKKTLYVSLIDGEPWAMDGKGGVALVGLDGKIRNPRWITGLNAPKGLGKSGNMLYVADVSQLVVIDILKGKITRKISIEGAQALNDVTVDSKGIVYVSDSKLGNIYRVENNKAELYLSGIKGANGLKCVGTDLYAISGPSVIRINSKKEISKVAEGFAKGGDGIEPVGKGDFIVSCWPGLVYYVKADGSTQLLMDTQQQKMNTADIGIYPSKNIVYIPTFNRKSVIAYQLK